MTRSRHLGNGAIAAVAAGSTMVFLGTLDAGGFSETYELTHRFFFPLAFVFHLCVGLVVGLGAGIIAGMVTLFREERAPSASPLVALFFGAALGLAPTLHYGSFDAGSPLGWIAALPPVVAWVVVPLLAAFVGIRLARLSVFTELPVSRALAGAALPLVVCGLVSVAMMARGDSTVVVEFPPAPEDDLPNVALLVADNLRADHLGCYGYELDITPHMDGLGREGVRFEQAVSTSNYTPPPHATLLTGNYPSRTGVVDRHRALPEANVTIAEILSDRGYATIGVISNLQVAGMFGYDQGFDVYDDSVVDMRAPIVWLTQTSAFAFLRGIGVSQFGLRALVIDRLGWISSISASRTNDRIFQYLDQARGRPWFLFVNYIDPHFPWSPPLDYEGRAHIPGEDLRSRDEEIELNQLFAGVLQDREHKMTDDFDADDMAYYLARYDREIEYLDMEVQRLVDRLRASGELDRTILVLTADHGEHFGEHELLYHHNSFYEELVDVPLIMRYPEALPQGVVVDGVVSLVDVPPTILDLIGAVSPESMQGSSLLPRVMRIADAANAPAEPGPPDSDDLGEGLAVSEWEGGRRLLATGRFRAEFVGDSLLSAWAAGLEPHERRNLAAEDPELADRLTDRMMEWLGSHATGGIRSREVSLDPHSEERLRALGYVD